MNRALSTVERQKLCFNPYNPLPTIGYFGLCCKEDFACYNTTSQRTKRIGARPTEVPSTSGAHLKFLYYGHNVLESQVDEGPA